MLQVLNHRVVHQLNHLQNLQNLLLANRVRDHQLFLHRNRLPNHL